MKKHPDGWFNGYDFQAYRSIMSKVPIGGKVVEIGAYKGRSLSSVASIIIDRKLKVCSVEPFLTLIEDDAAQTQTERRLSQTLKRLGFSIRVLPKPQSKPLEPEVEETLIQTLEDWGLEKKVKRIKKTSKQASRLFKNKSLDLVFVDGDHSYDGLVTDVYSWYPKLKSTGVMAGHDYVQSGGTILMHEIRSAIHDVFGGPDAIDNTTHCSRSTCWVALNPPIFHEQLGK